MQRMVGSGRCEAGKVSNEAPGLLGLQLCVNLPVHVAKRAE